METFDATGFFWLPDKPETRVTGTITFARDKPPELHLMGSFRDATALGSSGLHEYPVVYGLTMTGSQITLSRAVESKSQINWSSSGLSTESSVWGQNLFVGAHIPAPEDLHVIKIRVRFDAMEDWLGYSGFDTDLDTENKRLKMTYSLPPSEQFELSNLTLSTNYSFSTDGGRLTDFTLRQSAEWNLDLKQATDGIEDVFRYVQVFQNFLSFAYGNPTFPTSIILHTNETHTKSRDRGVQLLCTPYGISAKAQALKWHDMLFTYPSVKPMFSTLIQNWLQKHETLKPVFDEYFALVYQSSTYIEQSFLGLSHALEVYHRRTQEQTYTDTKHYAENVLPVLRQAIPAELPQGLRERISGSLAFMNEVSLRTRLKQLTRQHAAIINKHIPRTNEFVDLVVNTRNYLTHYAPELESCAAKGADLFRLTLQIQLIVELCIMSEIGLSQDLIAQVFQNQPKYSMQL